MAIRLNLYHETLRAKRQQQFDPLKLSFLGLLVVAICLAGYYFVQLSRTNTMRSEAAAKKTEFERLGPLSIAAKEREVELTKRIELADRMTQRMEKRFYWAPVCEAIVGAVPPSVQITKLSADNGARDAGRMCQLTLEGLAAGPEPRAIAEDLRKALADRMAAKYSNASATFRNLDDSAEHVKVDGKALLTAAFTIQISFKPEAEAAPAPKPAAQRMHKPIAQRD